MKEQRFKFGDKVTYKSKYDSINKSGEVGYYLGGSDQGGYVGRILSYYEYNNAKKCWEIDVTSRDSGSYIMLESDFLEYDEQPVKNEFFPLY